MKEMPDSACNPSGRRPSRCSPARRRRSTAADHRGKAVSARRPPRDILRRRRDRVNRKRRSVRAASGSPLTALLLSLL